MPIWKDEVCKLRPPDVLHPSDVNLEGHQEGQLLVLVANPRFRWPTKGDTTIDAQKSATKACPNSATSQQFQLVSTVPAISVRQLRIW